MPLYQTNLLHFVHALTTTTSSRVRAITDLEDWVISRSKADVRKVFNQVNTRKAASPIGIPECVRRACPEQLAGIITVIFNLFMTQSVIPMF